MHLEGTFEAELMFTIAERNDVELGYLSAEDLRAAYDFGNLQEFLKMYYQGVRVLKRERDFYDLTLAYLRKAHSQNVLHTEVFFDPQAHTSRGVEFKTVVKGIHRALVEAEEHLGISSGLIMCFLRDQDPASAMETLEAALPYKRWIATVGLDSTEVGNPPSRFQEVFARAREAGFSTVAHAGEEGPAEYIWQAIDLLNVSRIDHGVRSLEDERLVRELIKRRIPLTVCPLSNVKLGVVDRMEDHPIVKMLEKGLLVTINSDDPAYFGGYITENYLAVEAAFQLDKQAIENFAKHSFEAAFLDNPRREEMIARLNRACINKDVEV